MAGADSLDAESCRQMISYGLSNAFFWHWCGSESLKITKLDLSAFVRCDEAARSMV